MKKKGFFTIKSIAHLDKKRNKQKIIKIILLTILKVFDDKNNENYDKLCDSKYKLSSQSIFLGFQDLGFILNPL